MNSKTALYPLYAAVIKWWQLRSQWSGKTDREFEEFLWKKVVEEHVFVNCRIPYNARRVLAGYNESISVNTSVVDVISAKDHLKAHSSKKNDLSEEKLLTFGVTCSRLRTSRVLRKGGASDDEQS